MPDRVAPLTPVQPLPTTVRVPSPPEEEGIPVAGGFKLYPDINVGATYDTNVFATRNAEVSDWMWSVTPSLLARKETDKYKLDFRVGIEANRYQKNTNQDTDDHWAEGQIVYQLSPATNVYGGVGHSRSHEDRGSPNLSFGKVPTVYYDNNAFAGVFHDFGRTYVRLGVVNSNLTFDDVPTTTPGVTLINGDRNRVTTSIGGRVGFRLNPTMDLFVQGTSEKRAYQNTPDDSGYRRTSNGSRVAVGAAINFSEKLVGEAFVGEMQQDYDDARLRDVRAAEWGGNLRWHTSPWTTYKFSLDRTLEETVLPGASSYIATTVGARVEHDLAENTLFTAGLALGQNGFQGINRTDDVTDASIGIRHYVSPTVYLRADYSAVRRNSDDINAIYSRNLVSFLVGTDFGARRRNRYFSYEDRIGLNLENGGGNFGGLYIGAALGSGSLNTTAAGLRDATPGNTDVGDMGNESTATSFQLGYGKTFGQWYLGAELEVDNGNGQFSHFHGGAEPLNYSIRQKEGLGLGLRGGYVLESGSMIYGRAGVVRTTFGNTMQNLDGSFEQSFTQNGTRVGVGAEIPAGDNLFLRMDYAYTRYEAYHMVSTSYDEQYDNKSGMFSLGLGWRFGGPKQSVTTVDPTFLRGVYAGGQFAHGAMNSYLNSPSHYHAGGNDTLQADFGSLALSSSAFLGYGYTFNRWYLGLEAEIDPSLTRWMHDRTTSGGGGRDFSVNKKGGFGMDLRAGYVLANGALLYARAGGVRTKFNTLYERGNSGLVDREDTLNGSRIGLGAELPINKAAFWRLDYVMTDYGSAPTFNSPGGTPDTLNFTNKESLFRLGLGVRF